MKAFWNQKPKSLIRDKVVAGIVPSKESIVVSAHPTSKKQANNSDGSIEIQRPLPHDFMVKGDR